MEVAWLIYKCTARNTVLNLGTFNGLNLLLQSAHWSEEPSSNVKRFFERAAYIRVRQLVPEEGASREEQKDPAHRSGSHLKFPQMESFLSANMWLPLLSAKMLLLRGVSSSRIAWGLELVTCFGGGGEITHLPLYIQKFCVGMPHTILC